MATLAAVYDLTPQAPRPEDVLAELRPVQDASKPRPRAHNKRVWASVEKAAEEVTGEVFDEARRRDPGCWRQWVVLVDGDRHQINRVRAEAKRRGMSRDVTLVVDFIHVLEYLSGASTTRGTRRPRTGSPSRPSPFSRGIPATSPPASAAAPP